MKIIMTVCHGETKSEIVRGENFEVCLAYLFHTDLYKGYGPYLETMKELKEHKQFSNKRQ
jgi:hypothetical protein